MSQTIPPTIRLGSKGADVQRWQTIIGATVDGDFGPNTETLTKQWQASHKLVSDGVVGPATWGTALGIPSTPETPPHIQPSGPPGELPNKVTPISPDDAARFMSDGYLQVVGKRPSKEILSLLVGQSALETGNWHAIHNYNFGNFKRAPGDRNWQYFRCSEIENGVEVFYEPPDFHCAFAAYYNGPDGAAAYIRGLKARANWWNGLMSGTVAGFIGGLTTPPKYFTASPTLYQNTLTERVNNYASVAAKYAASWKDWLPKVFGFGVGIVLAGFGIHYMGGRK